MTRREQRATAHHGDTVGTHEQLGVVGQARPGGLVEDRTGGLGLRTRVLELVETPDDEHGGKHGTGNTTHE